MSNKIWQEFYCASSGGGCGGYFTVKLNMAINHRVEMVCPNCGHKHRRVIEKGQIKENGRYDGHHIEEIHVTKSAFSKTPKTIEMKNHAKSRDLRDGAVIKKPGDLVAQHMVNESWLNRFSGRLTGKA